MRRRVARRWGCQRGALRRCVCVCVAGGGGHREVELGRGRIKCTFTVICFSESVPGLQKPVLGFWCKSCDDTRLCVSFRAPAVDGAQAENHFIIWLRCRVNKSQLDCAVFFPRRLKKQNKTKLDLLFCTNTASTAPAS